MVSYIQIFSRKKEMIDAWKKIREKYGFSDDEIKDIILNIILELANNDEFYKKYIKEFQRRVSENKVVNPKQLLLELLFS